MATVGHIVYKTNDLETTIREFQSRGFDVEYGQARNPSSAVIYFCKGPYLEIRREAAVPPFFRQILRLTGYGKLVDCNDSFSEMPTGYSRIVLEVARKEFGGIKKVFNEHNVKSLTIPIARRDPSGRRLSCHCLTPDDWAIPLFVTPFAIDTHRENPHPNGITHMDNIVFDGTSQAVSICDHVGIDEDLTYGPGAGTINLEFV